MTRSVDDAIWRLNINSGIH